MRVGRTSWGKTGGMRVRVLLIAEPTVKVPRQRSRLDVRVRLASLKMYREIIEDDGQEAHHHDLYDGWQLRLDQ